MENDRAEAIRLIKEAQHKEAPELALYGLGLTEVPPEVGDLSHLRTINLSDNRLTEFPSVILKLKDLTSVSLWGNGLEEIPPSLVELKQLETLDLSLNRLDRFPPTLLSLLNLVDLDLAANNIEELPDSISHLQKLRRLTLAQNALTQLPETLGALQKLEFLDVADNPLTELTIPIGGLKSLVELIVTGAELKKLPASLGNLSKLKGLYLSNNQISRLPRSVAKLRELEVLTLAHNPIGSLTGTFRQLTNLERLDLENTQLKLLPPWLHELSKLKYLDLTRNLLSELPETIRQLHALERLYLQGNEPLGLPAEVLGAGYADVGTDRAPANPRDILDYYFRVRGGRRPLNEAKLILVGRGGVGKTSLVNRLVHNRFVSDEKKTEGICITEWEIPLPDHERARLNVWDFGGQEIMHATHQFFLTQRSLYLLVLNGRGGGEDADAEYWLKLIDSFGDDSPVIVVMNKIREHPFDLNRRALQQKYPIRRFIKTDCSDHDGSTGALGIDELRESIITETHNLEHLRDSFPTSWFSIKNQLSGMKKNFLGFEQFRELCSANGESDTQAQERLAIYLHNLGIILNYRDDPRLQDTHVLNPHWVTQGIYKILNSDKLAEQKGEIYFHQLAEILDDSDYPTSMRVFIFDLMKKFDLCFSFPDDDSHYLVPELLDKQEPPQTADFLPEECLNFQYHYPVLPEGLLPRFIVRTHILSEGLARWRTGVFLRFDGNRALVKADIQDRKVIISVDGPTSGRRRLLAVIRSDWERIHNDIRNLQPQEMVPLPNHPAATVSYQKLLVMERQGLSELPEVIADRVVTLKVAELLNGVDLDGTRDQDKAMTRQKRPARLFYSYSHKDESLRNELETHLKLLQRQGLISAWSDRNIDAGDEWKQRISENLETADIVLLLISSDFLASDYCFDVEMRRALERHESGEARVIPVIVRDVNWKNAPFAKLQALPTEARAVTKWPDKDTAWRDVSEGIEKVISALPQRRHPRERKKN